MLNVFGSSGRILSVLPLTLPLFTVLPEFAVSDQTPLALAPLQYCIGSRNNLNVGKLQFVLDLVAFSSESSMVCPPGILIIE
jgi:hypothetical protein